MRPSFRRVAAALFVVANLIFSSHITTAELHPATSVADATMNAAEIQLALQKLNVLGRALYVAAHPDDENTNLIAYWANGALLDAAYLSITRGDGGQNLIGAELGQSLGVIRTQELLAARRIDRGQQFFTRAIDFGFSKNPEETLRIWDREKILADTVWVIRKFRPDVIVTRFATEGGPTHGHHTASAQLAREAFHAAGDPARFPEQLAFVQPWQPRRLLWNTSRFFFQDRKEPFDISALPSLEVGGYSPLLGKSFAEIAAASRSMHKSQGFGVPVNRNARKEVFQFLAGNPMNQPAGDTGLFDGIDTTWARLPGAEEMTEKIRKLIAAFAPTDPPASVPALLELRQALTQFRDDTFVPQKSADLDRIIAACLGLHLEAVTDQPTVRPGEALPMQIEAVNRSPFPVKLREVRLLVSGDSEKLDATLATNTVFTKKLSPRLPATLPFSQPYWLREPGTLGAFRVDNQTLIGRPENPPIFPVEAVIDVGGQELRYTLDTSYRKTDPVQGEVHQPLVVAPPVLVELPSPVFVFGDKEPKTIVVRVIASADTVQGQLALEVPAGWQVEPSAVTVELKGREAEAYFPFTVKPPAAGATGEEKLSAGVEIAGRRYGYSQGRTVYPHIPPQVSVAPAEAKLVRADIKTKGNRTIGYIPGAGDAIPESLREIGYTVKILTDAEIKADALTRFDAVILGVRAFNVQSRLGAWLPELLAYAKKGGVVIAQYNTAGEQLKTDRLGPYPLHLSRERVTDETAEVRILAPDHPLVNTPNRITAADFDGWVQERGLYFPDTWDAAWTPIFSSHDPGEKGLDGGLLVAKTGDGFWIYTGYSWFRQLPAGVPGAYRIFANMISLGK